MSPSTIVTCIPPAMLDPSAVALLRRARSSRWVSVMGVSDWRLRANVGLQTAPFPASVCQDHIRASFPTVGKPHRQIRPGSEG